MKKTILVSKEILDNNPKRIRWDLPLKPPFEVQTDIGNFKGHDIIIHGPCMIRNEPRITGNSFWIETDMPVIIYDHTTKTREELE
jgi:hypothetical protein